MAEPTTTTNKTSSMIPDWSQLPEELLHVISEKLEDCFDVVHARSVSTYWRSAFPFPSSLLRPSYSLPSLSAKSKGLCNLRKIPLFLFSVPTPPAEYFLGGVVRDESEDHMELSSPLHCSVKVKMPRSGSEPTLMNMILLLGHEYRMIGWDPKRCRTSYRDVAFLPLNKEGRGESIVLLGYSTGLSVLTSAEMRWKRLKNISRASCTDLVTFRGRFYVVFTNSDMFVIDPYSLEATPLMPPHRLKSHNYLVPSGNDELFLVQLIIPLIGILTRNRLTCKVSRLDEEAGKWVEANDVGDRVLFIGQLGNVSCSAKELPNGCGLSGNSVFITHEPFNATYSYKYGVGTECKENNLSFFRPSREPRVTILSTSALQVER